MTPVRAASPLHTARLTHYIAVAVTLGVIGSLVTHSPLPAPLALFTAIPIRSRMVRASRRQAEGAQRSAVVELCAALRGELQAGRQPSAAFAEAVWCRPELTDLANAVCAPVPTHPPADLLTAAARIPGREGLASLAACWRAAETHGISLTGALSSIEDGLRAELSRRQKLATEMAGTRSTIAILGVLPLLGLALGAALGADPLHTLLSRPAGEACLVVGYLLELIGFRWTDRLVSSAESTLNATAPTHRLTLIPSRTLNRATT